MFEAKISEFKSKLSAYVARARRGETIIIVDRNTPVAKLVPIDTAHGIAIREPKNSLASITKLAPVRRTIDRMRLLGALDDDDGVAQAHQQLLAIENAIAVLLLDRVVIQRASLPMPTAVNSLDAIHLASALLCREHRVESLTFSTQDSGLGRAATALGFPVIGL